MRTISSTRTSVKAGDAMYSRDGKLKGLVVNLTSRGCHEGCLGTRLAVRWPGKRITYPCSAGLTVRKDGDWQIA